MLLISSREAFQPTEYVLYFYKFEICEKLRKFVIVSSFQPCKLLGLITLPDFHACQEPQNNDMHAKILAEFPFLIHFFMIRRLEDGISKIGFANRWTRVWFDYQPGGSDGYRGTSWNGEGNQRPGLDVVHQRRQKQRGNVCVTRVWVQGRSTTTKIGCEGSFGRMF